MTTYKPPHPENPDFSGSFGPNMYESLVASGVVCDITTVAFASTEVVSTENSMLLGLAAGLAVMGTLAPRK